MTEEIRHLKSVAKAITAMHCSINSLGAALSPGSGPVPPVKNFTSLKCCDANCDAVISTTCYTTELVFVPADPGEPTATPTSTSKCCGVPTTVSSGPAGTYEVGETTIETTYTYPDGTPYTGDLAELDPTCVLCNDCIANPQYEIFQKEVCFEDCTKGCIVFKLNTCNDEITKVDTLDQNGDPTTLAIAPCPEYQVIETQACEI